MKKIDRLVIKSFIGPLILTFFIAQFVLVMQFLWKYVDDLVGKGLNTGILLELLLYASARLVPMALPLAILVASIMTLGAFGEHFELTAIKSSGVSLLRFIRALALFVIGLSVFAFFFSNNLLPKANLKFGALLYDIRHQKPTVAIKPGIFYSGIDGFYIRVEDKDDETNSLYKITVYDHTSGKGNDHVITAEKGQMLQDEEATTLTLRLENGKQYREIDPQEPQPEKRYEMVSTQFKSWEKKFDLSAFKLSRTDENFFKDLKQMLNLQQLYDEIDTIHSEEHQLLAGFNNYLIPYYAFKRMGADTVSHANEPAPVAQTGGYLADLNSYDQRTKIQILEKAMNKARNIKNFADVTAKQMSYKSKDYTTHMIEVYRKFTLSVACLVLFFIGAPLGSIIRKGGLGWPLFYSVIFFILYHVTGMIGEKLAENNVLTAFGGMWLSTAVLLPMGLFLTMKATSDSKIFSVDYYTKSFGRLKPVKTAQP
ncbi:MAG: LptF/LptG family permease [Bacteroidetes bacterium]|nr:LptF/LptG family permease [Bacteroidota bacterium]